MQALSKNIKDLFATLMSYIRGASSGHKRRSLARLKRRKLRMGRVALAHLTLKCKREGKKWVRKNTID